MEDIPQPKNEPYQRGENVQIYLGENDAETDFHELECTIVDRFKDDLDSETGRELDAYSYRLRQRGENDPLPVQFRHFDLVPTGSY